MSNFARSLPVNDSSLSTTRRTTCMDCCISVITATWCGWDIIACTSVAQVLQYVVPDVLPYWDSSSGTLWNHTSTSGLIIDELIIDLAVLDDCVCTRKILLDTRSWRESNFIYDLLVLTISHLHRTVDRHWVVEKNRIGICLSTDCPLSWVS